MTHSTHAYTNEDIVLAFAGIQQAAVLIQQLATTGECDEAMFFTSINSLYAIDAPNVPSIFGGRQGLKLGLASLNHLFHHKNKHPADKQIAQYLLSIIHAERYMAKKTEAKEALAKKIRYIKNQSEFFTPTHEQVIKNLGHIYEQTIGTLPFKIGILGQRNLLSKPEIMSKIRALLLAGIRAAVLWQQVGGSRWHLFFTHWRYKQTLNRLL